MASPVDGRPHLPGLRGLWTTLGAPPGEEKPPWTGLRWGRLLICAPERFINICMDQSHYNQEPNIWLPVKFPLGIKCSKGLCGSPRMILLAAIEPRQMEQGTTMWPLGPVLEGQASTLGGSGSGILSVHPEAGLTARTHKRLRLKPNTGLPVHGYRSIKIYLKIDLLLGPCSNTGDPSLLSGMPVPFFQRFFCLRSTRRMPDSCWVPSD